MRTEEFGVVSWFEFQAVDRMIEDQKYRLIIRKISFSLLGWDLFVIEEYPAASREESPSVNKSEFVLGSLTFSVQVLQSCFLRSTKAYLQPLGRFETASGNSFIAGLWPLTLEFLP